MSFQPVGKHISSERTLRQARALFRSIITARRAPFRRRWPIRQDFTGITCWRNVGLLSVLGRQQDIERLPGNRTLCFAQDGVEGSPR